MAVDLRKETYSALSRRPAQIMQIPIKEDVIVPDSKPDVGRILQTGVRFAPEESTSLRYCIWGMEIPARYIV